MRVLSKNNAHTEKAMTAEEAILNNPKLTAILRTSVDTTYSGIFRSKLNLFIVCSSDGRMTMMAKFSLRYLPFYDTYKFKLYEYH